MSEFGVMRILHVATAGAVGAFIDFQHYGFAALLFCVLLIDLLHKRPIERIEERKS